MAARRIACMVLGAGLLLAPPVSAQEQFREFISQEDLFSANFPGTPVVTNIMWETEYGAKIPGCLHGDGASAARDAEVRRNSGR